MTNQKADEAFQKALLDAVRIHKVNPVSFTRGFDSGRTFEAGKMPELNWYEWDEDGNEQANGWIGEYAVFEIRTDCGVIQLSGLGRSSFQASLDLAKSEATRQLRELRKALSISGG